MTDSPNYVFTEAVPNASEATPEWASWLEGSTNLTSEHVREYFAQFLEATAETENDMALLVLSRNNMGGGVPIEVLRKIAQLSKAG
jgi:hypothetical protein